MHSLLGSNAIVSVNIALAKAQFKNAKTDSQLSVALHYLGDAYAHQRMNGKGYYGDKGKVKQFGGKMFEKLTGGTAEHAKGSEPDGTDTGLRPDMIYERVNLYTEYVNTLAGSLKDKYQTKGQIDTAVFKRMTDYATKNKVSLIGIMNYEVAKLKGENTFNIMRSTGLADDNWSVYIRNTENYLQENKINYKTDGVYSESLGGAVKTLEGYKFTIIK
jgi:hypothetical protein